VADDQNTLRYGARGYLPLLEKAGIALDGGEAAADFLVACRKLRLWAREDRAQA